MTALYPTGVLARGIDALARLEEATKRYKAKSTNTKPVDKLQSDLGKLFVKQGRHLVAALDPLRKYFVEDIGTDFDSIFNEATLETSADMQETTTKAVRAVLLAGGKNVLSELGIKISFSLDNPRAAQYLAKYGANFISGIDETTKTDIKALLQAGIDNGYSYAQVAQQIKARYKQYAVGVPQEHIRSRAELISITELGNAYQAGNYIGVQAITDTGLKMQKKWLTLGDSRVSDGCKANAAEQWIPLDQEFSSGHQHPLRFPGCRCVLLYQRDTTVKPTPVVPKPTVEPPAATAAKYKPLTYNDATGAEVNDALGDLIPGSSSNWNKTIKSANIRALGLYETQTGQVTMSTAYDKTVPPDEKFKALVHELIHGRSKGQRDYFSEGLGWEEAITEANAQLLADDVATKIGYVFKDKKRFVDDFKRHPYYAKWIVPMNDALDELGVDHTTFYKSMVTKTCEERADYFRSAYKKKYPKGNTAREKFLALSKVMQ